MGLRCSPCNPSDIILLYINCPQRVITCYGQYNAETQSYTDYIQITLVFGALKYCTDEDPNKHSFILLQNHCSQLGHLSADTS